jgi:23S rRNA (cytosine1962-C5)-methyltransferase
VRVESHDGRFLAWASFSPSSQIRVRAWSFDEAERIDAGFFQRRIAAAVAMRQRLAIQSNGVRLIHGEADGLPGLIVDRYEDILSVQFLSAGTERWKAQIADALLAETAALGCTRLYERSDSGVRQMEGLEPAKGWLRGGGDTTITLREHSIQLTVDVEEGHKTGYYLDQRENRALFARLVAQFGCQSVLNCYSYTGGFSVSALAGGATEVVSVDSSGPALARPTPMCCSTASTRPTTARWTPT